ncbi:Kelch repeat-containing protein [Zavarzinella formosa]|uniref:Kelch repeat-containing protein n=1 Tax=Zavarzinella formosa TaxID=360055 RepID=UPI0002D3AEE8|nr:hypothetical protein [Zavarzinella formosa]
MNRLFAITLLAAIPFAASAESPAAATAALPELPRGVSSFGAVTVGDYLYAYGGHAGKAHTYSSDTTSGDFHRLNLLKPEKWEKLDGGVAVQGTALVAHGDKIYRVGGLQPMNKKEEKTDIRSLASVSVYDTKAGKWAEAEPLPEARSSHDAIVVGDTLFVFGGWQLNGSSAAGKSVWLNHGLSLDLSKTGAKWEIVKQPFQRRALTMAAFDGKVCVIGGLGEKSTDAGINIYDPKSATWSTGPAIPGDKMNAFSPSAATLDGKLYLTPKDGKVYRMTEKKDAWETVGEFKQGRFVARMVGHGKNLIVVAGASPAGMLASLEAIVPATVGKVSAPATAEKVQ